MVCTAHQNCFGDQTEKNEMGGACSITSMGDKRGAYRVLVGKPEGKRLFGTPRYKWEDKINVNLQDMG